jgi:alkanesulfonate monooxygenase SsuD/methylene tetrahydromethanopterin reductase-like flavin-dependent oxidoreductase (luciferase family)
MKVYVMDLLAYGRRFDEFSAERYIPYPLPREHFDPELAARTYDEHLEAWTELDRLGFDGVGLNEHHTTPHGLMVSPNMMAAAGAKVTTHLKFVILGNLLSIHNPLRIAEELAMADCLSRGRIISGFARGLPREHSVYGIPMGESRERFEEAVDIIVRAWTEETFSHDGKFWKYQDIAIWPRPYQQPHPPVWMLFAGSKETIDFAGERNFTAVLPQVTDGLTEDIISHYAKALAAHGHTITPEHLCVFTDAWVAESRAAAFTEYSPWYLYFNQMIWHHGSVTRTGADSSRPSGYVSSSSLDHVRPENRGAATLDRERIRKISAADVEARVAAGRLAWGPPGEVATHLIGVADRAGAHAICLNLNLGALPHELFMEQIRRFGRDVLPQLQAHEVKNVQVRS